MKEAKTKRTQPYTVKEAAEYLGQRPAQIRDFCARKLIKYSKAMPGKWLLDAESVETFMERTA